MEPEILKIGERIKQEYIEEIEKYISYNYLLDIYTKAVNYLEQYKELDISNKLLNAQNEEEDEKSEESDFDERTNNIDNKKADIYNEIKDILKDYYDEYICEDIIERLEQMDKERDIKKNISLIFQCIETILGEANAEVNDIPDIIERLQYKRDICILILDIIEYSEIEEYVLYPNEWSNFDITEIAKVFAIDKVYIDSQYMKIVYKIYEKKCKDQISKLGVKLSYYTDMLSRKLSGEDIKITKEEEREALMIGTLQRCLNARYNARTLEGPFLEKFALYGNETNEEHILASDIEIINYLFEEISLVEEELESGEISINDDENKKLLAKFESADITQKDKIDLENSGRNRYF